MTEATETPEFMSWTWADIEPRYQALESRELTKETIDSFLREWSEVVEQVEELGARLKVASDINTADEEASARFRAYIEEIDPKVKEAEHRLEEKLLAGGLTPKDMAVPLRNMRVDTELFRQENLPLESEEALLAEEYLKLVGGQTVEWDGKEIPLTMLVPVMEEQDRERRERAWRTGARRRLQDRAAVDEIWGKLLDVRQREARNADFPDYFAYRWREMKRFDYTPNDIKQFHRSVEKVVVPAVSRMFERRRRMLDLESIRPWDRDVDVLGRGPVHPYQTADELATTMSSIFHHVDPALGGYFDQMRQEGLLDLETRKNKAPGGYCITFSAVGRPFIFGNATGIHDDVVLLSHEGGHAFHVFEMQHLPYAHQRGLGSLPIEFAEVASMGMELLASPYLAADQGGFYSREDAARVRLAHLEGVLSILPWIAVVDAFQHWVYEHPEEAADPARCEDEWAQLMRRFMPYIDWSGLEEELRNDWRRIPHLFASPLYFLEYALAQLGAVQVWANARRDQAEAVRQYRHALSLGGTRTLPELYAAAGVRFAFDEETIQNAVTLLESTIDELAAEQERLVSV